METQPLPDVPDSAQQKDPIVIKWPQRVQEQCSPEAIHDLTLADQLREQNHGNLLHLTK